MMIRVTYAMVDMISTELNTSKFYSNDDKEAEIILDLEDSKY